LRLYLDPVPASERKTVQLLGARWDTTERLFWIDPEWNDASRFFRWLPEEFVRGWREGQARINAILEAQWHLSTPPDPNMIRPTYIAPATGGNADAVVDIRYSDP